jgi:poly(A) polymerase
VRQAIEFNFSIEVKTGQHLQQAAPILITTSPERKREELLKLLNTTAPGRAVQLMGRYQVLSHLLPEVETTREVSQGPPHHLDVFDHTARALDAWADMLKTRLPEILSQFQPQVEQYLDEELAGNLTRRQLLSLALLWHDVGKPLTRTIAGATKNKIQFIGHERKSAQIAQRVMKEFRFSNQAVEFVRRVIVNHMRPLLLAADGGKISRRAIYRYFQATNGMGEQTGVAVILHALADHRAIYPPESTQEQTARKRLLAVSQQLIAAYFDKRGQVVDPAPLLAGRDLIEIFGLPQGQLIGLLLARLIEAQAMGQVADRASALDFIENDPDFIKNRSKSDV